MAMILVVDDEAGIRELLGTLLEREGYDVVLADGGKQGLAVFKKARPHAVILDLKMAEMNGLTVLREIRMLDRQKPVIIFTGVGSLEAEQYARELGATAYLHKEFSLHHLGEALTRALA